MNQSTSAVVGATQRGIAAVKAEEYLLGITLLTDVYGAITENDMMDARVAEGLSYYGLCVALVQKKFKVAVDLCRKAIELQFYNGHHYANLTRVYLAADKRKKALETVEEGLKVMPGDEELRQLRHQLGLRSSPPVPFLPRSNPINVALGRARHARKARDDDKNGSGG